MTRLIVALTLLGTIVSGSAVAAEVSRTFDTSADRLWTATEAVLTQLGWKIEKANREIGWITTESRRIEDGDYEDYGVYEKGTRHRLRLIIKEAGPGKATATVERMVFTRERILFRDNDETVPTTDRSVEESILNAIGKGL
jgi:hypothetical protein